MQLSLSLANLVRAGLTTVGFGLALQAQAQFTYVTNNNAITITKYTCAAGPVVVPATINGLPVVEIGPSAFKSCASITRVELPSGVVTIGVDAFRACSGITNLALPSSIRNVGDGAFANCSALKSVVIPGSVLTLSPFAFFSCTSLTNVTIPNGVVAIQNFAFGACVNLPAVTLPESVTTIGAYAFSGLSALTTVVVPKSVKTLGVGVFSSCSTLTTIGVQDGSASFASVDGVLFDKSKLTLIQFPGGKSTEYTVPSGTTRISDAAFKGSGLIESVSIPDTVTRLGEQAFYACANLKSVSFGGNAPTEGTSLFVNSKNVIVYITAGASGWGATYGERPVTSRNLQLWVPQINGPIRALQFPFKVLSPNDLTFVVEACQDIENPVWVPIGTNSVVGGTGDFVDTQRTNYVGRWYRVRVR